MIDELCLSDGFDSFIKLQKILHQLSLSNEQKHLSNISFQNKNDFHNNDQMEKVYNFINTNYTRKISLTEVAQFANLTTISLGRLIKKRTGKTFVDFANEIRLGNASRQLIETDHSIAEICFATGFNNLSNFNRVFKKRQNCTPAQFRQNFTGSKKLL